MIEDTAIYLQLVLLRNTQEIISLLLYNCKEIQHEQFYTSAKPILNTQGSPKVHTTL